jgi:hypothetical protein
MYIRNSHALSASTIAYQWSLDGRSVAVKRNVLGLIAILFALGSRQHLSLSAHHLSLIGLAHCTSESRRPA